MKTEFKLSIILYTSISFLMLLILSFQVHSQTKLNQEQKNYSWQYQTHPDTSIYSVYFPSEIKKNIENVFGGLDKKKLKGYNIESSSPNVLLQNDNITITYLFEDYKAGKHIEFNVTFNNESQNNYVKFYFDLNNNGVMDFKYDPIYSYNYIDNDHYEFCSRYQYNEQMITYCGWPSSDGWMVFDGSVKSFVFNVPLDEITLDENISFYLVTNHGCFPNCGFSDVFTIQTPENIDYSNILETKLPSAVTQNSGIIEAWFDTSNSDVSETGLVWSNSNAVSLANNIGVIVNTTNKSELKTELKNLESNERYFYRAYVVIDELTVYGSLGTLQTSYKNSQFTILNDNILVSKSGKNAIALVSETDFEEWHYKPSSTLIKTVSTSLFEKLEDDFDLVFYIVNTNERREDNYTYGVNYSISNNIKGIGRNIYNASNNYGTPDGVQSAMWIPTIPLIKSGPTLHEISHNWANYLLKTKALVSDNTSPSGVKEIDYYGHWGVCTAGGQLGGFNELVSNVNGQSNKYQGIMKGTPGFGQNANGGNTLPYSDIELYLMGFIPLEELQPVTCFYKLSANSYNEFRSEGIFYSDSVVEFDQDKIREIGGGVRMPNSIDSQKDFKMLFVLISHEMPTNKEITDLDEYAAWLTFKGNDNEDGLYNFYEATGGRAILSIENCSNSIISSGNDTTYVTICDGETYDFGSQTLSIAGEYTEVFKGVSGSDSTVVLSLSVIVVEKPIIAQNADTLTCNIGGEYTWYFNDEVIKDAIAQVYVIQSSGQYQVTVTNENGCHSLRSDVTDVIKTAVKDLEFAKNIVVYPNPTNGEINIAGLNISGETRIQVLDATGRKVFSLPVTSIHKEIDITGFAPGIYHLIISKDNSSIDYKIIKK